MRGLVLKLWDIGFLIRADSILQSYLIYPTNNLIQCGSYPESAKLKIINRYKIKLFKNFGDHFLHPFGEEKFTQ